MIDRDERKKKFLLNTATFTVAIALGAVLVKFLLGWILPFVFGFLIAAAVQPAVRFAHRHWRLPKRAAGLLLALLLILGLLGICAVILARLIMTATPMVQQLPQYLQALVNQVNLTTDSLTNSARSVSPVLAQNISNMMEGLSTELMKVSTYANQLLALGKSLLASLPNVLFGIAVTILSACFFSMDYDIIRGFLLRQLPERYTDIAVEVKRYFFRSVGGMARAYALLMLITFLELTCGLMLLRIPNAILVAVLIAVVDILPVLGTGTIMVPWAIITLLFGNIPLAVGLTVLYAVIATVRTILEPKVVGDRIGLYPLVTLFAIFLGLKFAGVAGMLLFPLIVLILKRLNDTGKVHLWK
ncbi:sporulation integral membrane protein YtvI [Ethanoligenens harbinense]|uniref:Sporulation integral membrane protein YtvI n=1 Tax=Ethanoligenens harbinense (strain DSM 18485 / JCM 12961 / CGMCC 1.5033 / YUAN-3) TaxID=663278 RepID=E6U8E2_ETHHY|nr:sporulation integral membrane protein YtvI [Ethanoligenens harbinense]ADU28261.1 sporulation integral membrane protein YtvI [Ethanoligenens harbinense YUAN-3]AVQ97257.1 sporulation integral membrane protein YtvI [Ethanoligenens harbinense YUAN-3]AYF39921.1 sporulation integral membrane protein YtvI [Ethanoligenens harbinense]AYF42751.1 sporulation integral membrane protein YtvI [Ethanoligenens harbinense]QCN93501.1 sporulation integral membrane protein YtvI [Ethanoligenens harbinense]